MAFGLEDIKKFLKSDAAASIARQALGIPVTGEGNETPPLPGGPMIKNIAAPPVNVPAPTRTVTTTPQQPVLTAPVSAVPPPTRVPMSELGTPPPPPEPGYINTLEDVLKTVDTNNNPMAAPIPEPVRRAPIANPGAPLEPTTPMAVPPPTRVFMGEQTTPNMTAAQRAAAKVRALQSDTSGASAVRETPEGFEVAPPSKLGRLKAMGKMFLQRMLAGSQYGLGGMLGAGAVGAVEGGVDPGHAQKVIRTGEIERAQGEQAKAQTLEARDLQNQAQTLNVEQDRQAMIEAPQRRKAAEANTLDDNFRADLARLQEQHRIAGHYDPNDNKDPASVSLKQQAAELAVRYGRKVELVPYDGAEKKKAEPHDVIVDGQILRRDPEGNYAPVYGQPKSDETDANRDQEQNYQWQLKKQEADTKRTEIAAAAAEADSKAKIYRGRVDAAAAQVSVLDQQIAALPPKVPETMLENAGEKEEKEVKTGKLVTNPQIEVLTKRRDALAAEQKAAQTEYDNASKERESHNVKLKGITDPPPPPTRSKKTASVAGRTITKANLARYAKDHNITPEDALAGPLQGVVVR